jgi:hypothetical protein
MKKHLLAILAACVLGGTARAGISYSSSANLTTWNGTPAYTSIPSASLSSAATAQSDPTITGNYGVMAEMFTPASAFTLASFNVLFSINNPGSYQFHLYDLGPAGTVSSSSSSATYTPGSDLFSGLSLSLSSSGGEVQGQFSLSGADQVSLAANESYALEIWTPAANGSSGITWYRLPSNTPSDPGGQMFSAGSETGARNTLAGNGQAGGAPRTASLALYAVPEPSTLAMIGLALTTSVWVVRRRKN